VEVRGDAGRQKRPSTLVMSLDEQFRAMNLGRAELEADAVLELISGDLPMPDN